MSPFTPALVRVKNYLQQSDSLPSSQLRKLGLVYSSYRLIVSVFFLLMVYVAAQTDSSLLLPSLLQQTGLVFYFLLSLILLGLFCVVTQQPQRQLTLGLAIDVVILSLLLYTNGAPDLQLTMLYMVVVAASFMLLPSSQALIITLLAIILVIYQQFFYAIASSMSLTNLGDALLMSASFLIVGFLSWTISQRLLHVEQVAAQQAKEVERLNDINQEVVSQMMNGVIVIESQQIVLANHATYQLLAIAEHTIDDSSQIKPKFDSGYDHTQTLQDFQQQLAQRHPMLLEHCLSLANGQSRSFTYELPKTATLSTIASLRVQIIPLKDSSRMIILEDLRREHANAQQLKLASLGQLTASIAHEIRNPLAAISQASQLLMEEVEALPTAQQRVENADHELYRMIFAQTKRVNRIIEDVLKLSRQQAPNKQTVALSSWMPDFLTNYFSGHDVFLRCEVQPVVQFDTQQLEQILVNLINNGLRYSSLSHPHAYVEINIYYVANDVVIDILDEGSGVAKRDIEHLFEPFFTTSSSGTGLGLYLSQAFSEANQARLLYVAEHQRTCFRLLIPAI